jgi:hypothetical protein
MAGLRLTTDYQQDVFAGYGHLPYPPSFADFRAFPWWIRAWR